MKKKYTGQEMLKESINVDVAMDRLYDLANDASVKGEIGVYMRHPAFYLAHLHKQSDKTPEAVWNAYKDFTERLKEDGFKLHPPCKNHHLWITWYHA
jgi:hypothetical protein